jgi:hypothetical protein
LKEKTSPRKAGIERKGTFFVNAGKFLGKVFKEVVHADFASKHAVSLFQK